MDPKDQYEEVQKYLNFLFHNTTGKEVLSFLSWAIITKFQFWKLDNVIKGFGEIIP